MKYIRKGKEPDSLTQHRLKPHSDYDNYKEKDNLRQTLLKEQGYICCYCMQRINMDKMKIEHWHPQSKLPDKQLDYKNILGACMGNEGQPEHLQHCDTQKGDKIITINPTNENCESFIKFSVSGKISSDNELVNKDLNETLNLNQETLRKNREAVLDEAIKSFQKRHAGQWTREILEREISRWSSSNNGVYKPYCQIVVYYFQKKLSRR
jgi:uncharacterized protein (TIGR02646 family)